MKKKYARQGENKMTVRLISAEIEGLRGINSPVKMDFSEGMNLLVGGNGTGKTSILQAIEWCITGKIPSFSGPEFTREDAIVNLFHPNGQARVTLHFQDEQGHSLTIERKRARKDKTAGKNPQSISFSGKTYKDEDAADILNKSFAMKYEDFSKYCYLHQEDVRRILSEDPDERSESIDTLLGTIQLRELAQAIDVKKKIATKIGDLEDHKNQIKKVEIESVNRKRKRIGELSESLIHKGYSEKDLLREAVYASLLEFVRELENEATRFSTIIKISKEDMKNKPLHESLNALERQITEVDRSRISTSKKSLGQKMDLEKLGGQHKYYKGQVQQLKGLDLEESTEKLKELEQETRDAERKSGKVSSDRAKLERLKQDFARIERLIEEKEKQLAELGTDSTADLKNTIKSLEGKITETDGVIHKFSELARLQELSRSYLEANPTDQCPICSQSINVQSLLNKLKKTGMYETAERIKELELNRIKLNNSFKETKQKLEIATELSDSISRETVALRGIGNEIEKLTDKKVTSTQDVDKILKLMEDEESSLSKTLADKRDESNKLGSTINALLASLKQTEEIEKQIRSSLGAKSKGLELSKDLDGAVKRLEEETASHDDTKTLDELRTKVASLREIADYFREKQELEDLEQQARESSELLQDIETKISQLQNLQGSVEAIRGVIMEELKTQTSAAIDRLGQLLNQYYSAVTGHTYFTTLVFETDPKKPLLYNIRAVSADKAHSTYPGTRFSTAQMNLTAIALFLSMNHSAMAEVSTIIMDDPSQSMDLQRKKALAKLLCDLSSKRQIVLATQDAELAGEIRACSIESLEIYEFGEWSTNGPNVSKEKGK